MPQQMQQAHAYPAEFTVKLLHNKSLPSRTWQVEFGAEPNLVRDALSIIVDFFSDPSSPIQGAKLGYVNQGKFVAAAPGEKWRKFLQQWQQAGVQDRCLVLCMNGPTNQEIFTYLVAGVPVVATGVGTVEALDDVPVAQSPGVLSGLLTQFQGLSCALPKLDLPQNTASESSANHRRTAPHGVGWFPLHLDKPGFAQAVVQFVNNADDTEHSYPQWRVLKLKARNEAEMSQIFGQTIVDMAIFMLEHSTAPTEPSNHLEWCKEFLCHSSPIELSGSSKQQGKQLGILLREMNSARHRGRSDWALVECAPNVDRVKVLIELKVPGKLSKTLLQEHGDPSIWVTNRTLWNVCQQMYTYMAQCQLNYALLTTLSHSWVFYLPELPCTDAERKPIYISSAIINAQHTRKLPKLTIMGMVAFLQAISVGQVSPPPAPKDLGSIVKARDFNDGTSSTTPSNGTQPSSGHGFGGSSAVDASTWQKRSHHGEQGAPEGAEDCKEKSASQHPATLQAWHVVDLEDLQLHKELGRGASGVVLTGTVQGAAAAVKVFPEEWLEEAQHEANVYHALHHLWGTYIPKLLLTGVVAMYGWPFLALQQIPGRRLSAMGTLSVEVQRAAVRALRAVHDSGVLHGDIRLDNMLCVTLPSDQLGPCTTLTTSPCTPPKFSLVDMECSPREAVSGRTEAECTTRPESRETVCTSNSDSVSPASTVSFNDATEGGVVCVFVVDFGRAEVGACPAALAFEMADLRSQLEWCNSPT